LPLDGTSAMVLEIKPMAKKISGPVVFGAGSAATPRIDGDLLRIDHASGMPGAEESLGVLLPEELTVKGMKLNGRDEAYTQTGRYIDIRASFSGVPFSQGQDVRLSASANSDVFTGQFTVPGRILRQLASRKLSWPVPWDKADYETTWLVPERLLLYAQFAEPQQRDEVHLQIDGKVVNLEKAYSSVRVHEPSFVGWYADLSGISPDIVHDVRIQLPATAVSRFQGLFFDNVEAEWTEEIVSR
jgi:hypothetical protein